MIQDEQRVLDRPVVNSEHFDAGMTLASSLLVLSDSLPAGSPERCLLEDLGAAVSRALEVSQRAPQ